MNATDPRPRIGDTIRFVYTNHRREEVIETATVECYFLNNPQPGYNLVGVRRENGQGLYIPTKRIVKD